MSAIEVMLALSQQGLDILLQCRIIGHRLHITLLIHQKLAIEVPVYCAINQWGGKCEKRREMGPVIMATTATTASADSLLLQRVF